MKSAVKTADIYVGNCELTVTCEELSKYIKDETNIAVLGCEKLKSKYNFPNYNSFKVCVSIKDRNLLLSPDIWPEEVVCGKYYTPRNNKPK